MVGPQKWGSDHRTTWTEGGGSGGSCNPTILLLSPFSYGALIELPLAHLDKEEEEEEEILWQWHPCNLQVNTRGTCHSCMCLDMPLGMRPCFLENGDIGATENPDMSLFPPLR